jgi:hypothetical protein
MFYKRDNEQLLSANDVYAPGYELLTDKRNDYEYPTEDGWYWFDTLDEAMSGLPRISKVAEIDMRRARLTLHAAGLLSSVDAFVAAQGEAARIEWEYAQTIRRDHPLVVALPWSDEQKDALFEAAAAIT